MKIKTLIALILLSLTACTFPTIQMDTNPSPNVPNSPASVGR